MLSETWGYSFYPKSPVSQLHFCAFSHLVRELRTGFPGSVCQSRDSRPDGATGWFQLSSWQGSSQSQRNGIVCISEPCVVAEEYLKGNKAEKWPIPKGKKGDGRRWWSLAGKQELQRIGTGGRSSGSLPGSPCHTDYFLLTFWFGSI